MVQEAGPGFILHRFEIHGMGSSATQAGLFCHMPRTAGPFITYYEDAKTHTPARWPSACGSGSTRAWQSAPSMHWAKRQGWRFFDGMYFDILLWEPGKKAESVHPRFHGCLHHVLLPLATSPGYPRAMAASRLHRGQWIWLGWAAATACFSLQKRNNSLSVGTWCSLMNQIAAEPPRNSAKDLQCHPILMAAPDVAHAMSLSPPKSARAKVTGHGSSM